MNSESVGREKTVRGSVLIDGKSAIGRIDSDFICVTLDWWPPEKCDYGTCSWGHASLLNLVIPICYTHTHICMYMLLGMHICYVNCIYVCGSVKLDAVVGWK